MALRFLFRWSQNTALGTVVRRSTNLFPAIEVVHLLGLTLLLGSIIAMNLRLFSGDTAVRSGGERGDRSGGEGGRSRAYTGLFWAALVATIVTGIVLFLAEPLKCYYNVAFLAKMALLSLALLFHVTVHRRVRRASGISRGAARAMAVLSLALWFGVGVAGRFIGFI